MRLNKTLALSAAGLAALFSANACSEKTITTQTPTEIHTTAFVSVCKYTVAAGDGIEALFNSEMGKRFYKKVNVSTHDRFLLHGGRAGNQALQFSFNQYDVLRLVNGLDGKPHDKSWYDFPLSRGQAILMTDLNDDGRIMGQPCETQGTLTFNVQYDRRTRMAKKSIEYKGQKIEVN